MYRNPFDVTCVNCGLTGSPSLNDPKRTMQASISLRGYYCIDAIACYYRQIEALGIRKAPASKPEPPKCASCDKELPESARRSAHPLMCFDIAACNERLRTGARRVKNYRCVSCLNEATHKYVSDLGTVDVCARCYKIRSQAHTSSAEAKAQSVEVTITRHAFTFEQLQDFAVECRRSALYDGKIEALVARAWAQSVPVLDLAEQMPKAWPLDVGAGAPELPVLAVDRGRGGDYTIYQPRLPENGHPASPSGQA